MTSYDQTVRARLGTAAPAQAGVHAGQVRRFLAELHRRALPLHSLLLYRSGRVVAEHYWWPYRADLPHMMHSATKSLTGTAVGFALAEGRLRLADTVVSFFADQVPGSVSASAPLRAMTVGDLLTMRTGHRVGLSGKTWRLIDTSWVAEFLAAEVPDPPGERFTYSSATSHVLSAIVSRATGVTVAEYLRPRLFEPLGFAAHTWDTDPEGHSSGANGLSLRSVDFLKWGVLHLHDGWWQGRRVLPEGWVARATTEWVHGASPGSWDGARFVPVEPTGAGAGADRGYGYQVWLGRGDSYYASGMFGQDCVVLPRQDAVVAITAGIPRGRHGELSELVHDLLVPAFDGPGSPSDDRRLAEELAGAGEPPAAASPVRPAVDVAGREYRCEPNEDGVTGLRFDRAGDQLTVTLTDSRGVHQVRCGLAGWTESESTVTSWRLHHSYQPPRQRVVAGARWSTPRTLTLDWYFVESPFHDTVTVEFLPGDRLRWSRSVNVNSGDTTRPAITATATAASPPGKGVWRQPGVTPGPDVRSVGR